MTRTPLLITLLAAAALAGCDSGGQTIVQNGPPDPMANQLAAAPPVELPPAIAATKTYRCKDNSLVYIDWLEKNGQPAGANFRSEKAGSPTQLLQGEPGGPYLAEGYSLTGTKDAASITLTRPGAASQSCSG
uniref:hypothetical protein n=1 Tax=uncultured Sphingomonas sp. TaxID=158754 RepID=UPI0025D671CD|nr:hypothetical protein [uncultured Sphingomonas sp.]